jgi:transposase
VREKLAEGVSAELRDVLAPLLRAVESLNERIKEYDERMEKIAKEVYPEVSLLQQVKDVGTQIALTYVLTKTRIDSRRVARSHVSRLLRSWRSGCHRFQIARRNNEHRFLRGDICIRNRPLVSVLKAPPSAHVIDQDSLEIGDAAFNIAY